MTTDKKRLNPKKLPVKPKGRRWPNGPYLITEKGEIFSLITFRYIKPDKNNQVTLQTRSTIEGGLYLSSKKYYVHRLTAQMYVPCPDLSRYSEVIQTGPTSHYTNLRWVEHKEVKRPRKAKEATPTKESLNHACTQIT